MAETSIHVFLFGPKGVRNEMQTAPICPQINPTGPTENRIPLRLREEWQGINSTICPEPAQKPKDTQRYTTNALLKHQNEVKRCVRRPM